MLNNHQSVINTTYEPCALAFGWRVWHLEGGTWQSQFQ
jgi:hypothetical protein